MAPRNARRAPASRSRSPLAPDRARPRKHARGICGGASPASGAGRSQIGEHSFEWSQHDVFSIPHWTWASHEAHDGDADLFIVSDKSAYERLDLLREELQ